MTNETQDMPEEIFCTYVKVIDDYDVHVAPDMPAELYMSDCCKSYTRTDKLEELEEENKRFRRALEYCAREYRSPQDQMDMLVARQALKEKGGE